jgi:tetratricopeptide (TPR) repeat protein
MYRISVAESLENEADRDQAYAAYLEAYPDNSKIRREYVSSLSARGDWAAVAAQLELGIPYGEMGEPSRRLLAVSYRNAGRYRDAAVAYRDLLREEPASGDLLVGLAYCLDREGLADYALALLEKAPKAAKARADSWLLQASLYNRKGKVEAAAQALRAAIDRERGNKRAWRSLSALYRKQGLSELAANCEEEARTALAAVATDESADRGLADVDIRGRRR